MMEKFIIVFFFLHCSTIAICKRVNDVKVENMNHHIKWVTNVTTLPIRLEKYSIDTDADYKWYRYPDKIYINQLENYESTFRYWQTSEKVELDIFDYDPHNHHQLSSYVPVPIAHRGKHDEKDQPEIYDLFTMAYLAHHNVEMHETSQTFDYYCNVSIFIPHGDESLNKVNIDLASSNFHLKMGLLDAQQGKRLNLNKLANSASKSPSNRSKRSLAVFIEINENIGPLSIFKSQLASLGNDHVYCDLSLLEMTPAKGNKKTQLDADSKSIVFHKRILNKINPNINLPNSATSMLIDSLLVFKIVYVLLSVSFSFFFY